MNYSINMKSLNTNYGRGSYRLKGGNKKNNLANPQKRINLPQKQISNLIGETQHKKYQEQTIMPSGKLMGKTWDGQWEEILEGMIIDKQGQLIAKTEEQLIPPEKLAQIKAYEDSKMRVIDRTQGNILRNIKLQEQSKIGQINYGTEKWRREFEAQDEAQRTLTGIKVNTWRNLSLEQKELAIQTAREKAAINKEAYKQTPLQQAKDRIAVARAKQEGIIGADYLRSRAKIGEIPTLERDEAGNLIRLENGELPTRPLTKTEIHKVIKARKGKWKIGLKTKQEGTNTRIKLFKEGGTNKLEREYLRRVKHYMDKGLSEETASQIAQEEVNVIERKKVREQYNKKLTTRVRKRFSKENVLKTGFGSKWKGKTLGEG